MLDSSVFLNYEAVTEVEDLLQKDSETTVYAPESLYKFVLEEADEYYDYRKSSTLSYFKKNDPPSLQLLRDIFQSSDLSRFTIENSDAQFEAIDLSSRIRDSTSYYSRYPGYETLIEILTEEIHYLYSNSIISAVKDKIVELLRRIQAVTIYAGEEITQQLTKNAVKSHNFFYDGQDEFVNLYKWTLIGVEVTQIKPLSGLISFVVGACLGDKIVAVLDP